MKKLNIKEFLNSILKIQNSLFFFLIIYVICKFLGGLHLYGEKNFLEFNYLTYSFLSMILIIFNYLLINDKKKFIIFTSFISLFFVLIPTIFYTYVSLKVYFVNPDLMFTKWMYAVHPISNEVLSSPIQELLVCRV